MCSAQYGCFLEFLDFMFSWYVAHIIIIIIIIIKKTIEEQQQAVY